MRARCGRRWISSADLCSLYGKGQIAQGDAVCRDFFLKNLSCLSLMEENAQKEALSCINFHKKVTALVKGRLLFISILLIRTI